MKLDTFPDHSWKATNLRVIERRLINSCAQPACGGRTFAAGTAARPPSLAPLIATRDRPGRNSRSRS